MMLLLGVTYNATAQTATVGVPINTPYGSEYVVTFNGKEYRAITADHARAIQLAEAEASKVPSLQAALDAANLLIDQQKAQIADLKKLADLDQRLLDLRTQMDTIRGSIIGVQQSQHQDATKLLASMEAVQAGGKKTWLDKTLGEWPVKLGMTGLGIAANGRTAFFPPSPCQSIPMIMPTMTFRFGKH